MRINAFSIGIFVFLGLLPLVIVTLRRQQKIPDTLPAARVRTAPANSVIDVRRLSAQGAIDAAVGVVEFSSADCVPCAKFQQAAFPEIAATLISPGRIKYAVSEFPDPGSDLAKTLQLTVNPSFAIGYVDRDGDLSVRTIIEGPAGADTFRAAVNELQSRAPADRDR